MVGGAVEAKIDAEWDRRPCRVFGATVETYLRCISIEILFESAGDADFICWLCPELCENLLRLRLSRKSHFDESVAYRRLTGFGMGSGTGQMLVSGFLARRDEVLFKGQSGTVAETLMALRFPDSG